MNNILHVHVQSNTFSQLIPTFFIFSKFFNFLNSWYLRKQNVKLKLHSTVTSML